MNAGAGKNLNWFWKKWFFEPGVPDLAITSAKKTGNNLTIVVTSLGEKPVPVDLKILYADGSTSSVHRSIGVWEKNAKNVTITLAAKKLVSKVMLGAPHTPDINKKDNEWTFK